MIDIDCVGHDTRENVSDTILVYNMMNTQVKLS